jgi:hypothetical protein
MTASELAPVAQRTKVKIRRDPKSPAPAKCTSARARAPKKVARRNRTYASPEKMRAAYLAGAGKTSSEIAEALGNTTARKVRDVLRSCQIKLTRPLDRPKTIQIHCATHDLRLLEYRAEEIEYDPADLALAILRVVLGEPTILRNLLDIPADE